MNETGNTPEPVVVYDLVSLPEGMDFDIFAKVWKEHNVAVWDSSNGGEKPFIFNPSEEVRIHDVYVAGIDPFIKKENEEK